MDWLFLVPPRRRRPAWAGALAAVGTLLAGCTGAPSPSSTLGTSSTTTTAGSSSGSGGSDGFVHCSAAPCIISADALSTVEFEPTLAAAPNGTLVAAWFNSTQLGYASSTDHGVTWRKPRYVTHDSGPGVAVSDVWLAASADSRFHLAFLTVDPQFHTRVWVAESTDGSTFGTPVEASAPSSGLYDQPKILALSQGRLAVAFGAYAQGFSTMYADTQAVVLTRANGVDWTPTVLVQGTASEAVGSVALCSDGDHVVAVAQLGNLILGSDVSRLVIRWSDDGGQSWPPANTSQVSLDPSQLGGDRAIEIAPSCVARGSDLWVLFGATSSKTMIFGTDSLELLTSIRWVRSLDGGHTFAPPLALDGGGNLLVLPRLEGETGPGLSIFSFMGTNDGDPKGRFQRARSTDGTIFGPFESVAAPLVFTSSRSAENWLGDYVGAAHGEGAVYTVFVDNVSGYSHIASPRFQRPEAGEAWLIGAP